MANTATIDPVFEQWLSEQGRYIQSEQTLAGGCIANSRAVSLNDGSRLFIKRMPKPVPGLFAAEAAGLQALAETKAVTTPNVMFQNEHYLVLEYVEAASRSADFDEVLGRQLAALHKISAEYFGFHIDTYCGATQQPNLPSSDGYAFYTEQRFAYLAHRSAQSGLLTTADLTAIEQLCLRLPELIPVQPPVLLHGDLWSGNVHVDSAGQPVLIDPAVYYGWAEADLAMTKLFGGFSSRFYVAYQESRSLDPGWEERIALYNLWHLLNHLLLFGEGYLADVKQVIRKYA